MTLLVTSECVRLIDEETKSLAVDQTIEKVSFCTPDPNNERLFSYISRDGTTRRWMCHSFMAVRDTGERISHAVGCAFTACLQRKQKAMAAQQIAEQQQKTTEGSGSTLPNTTVAVLTPSPSQTTTTKSEPASLSSSTSSVHVQQSQSHKLSNKENSSISSPPLSQVQSPGSVTTSEWSQSKMDSVWDQLTQGISALSNGPSPLPAIPQSPVSTVPAGSTQSSLSPPPPAATKGMTTASGTAASTATSSIARRRPVPFNPSPFTRHMSLRTKANPLTFTPLKESTGRYETLAEENTPPRLHDQSGINVQPKHVNQPQQLQNIPPFSQNFTGQAPAPQVVQQQDPFAQNLSHANNPSQSFEHQNIFMQKSTPTSNLWPQSGVGLKPLPLNQSGSTTEDMWTGKERETVGAEQWLASAQSSSTGMPPQGILTPKNPFSVHNNGVNGTAGFESSQWSSNTPNGNGADDFTSLAERHNFSPTGSRIGNNPFKQDNGSVFWV